MLMDSAARSDGDATEPSHNRMAGFAPLVDASPRARPVSRTPFMPSPRKRAVAPMSKVSPVKVEKPAVPLGESHAMNYATDRASVHVEEEPLAAPRVAPRATPRAPQKKAQPSATSSTTPRAAVHTTESLRRPASRIQPRTAPKTVPQPAPQLAPLPSPAPRARIAPVGPRPATSMSVKREPTTRAPVLRTASPVRPSAHRPMRAKVVDVLRENPVARAQTALGTRSASSLGPTKPPCTASSSKPMPGAAQRVDVAAVEAELGDSSFVLDEIDADGADSVQVHLRLRPTAEDEECAWRTTLDTATIMLDPGIAAKKLQPNAGMAYHFDGLHTDSSNASLYASLARPLVQSVLRGYNALVFAYGQTASGKTFTLSGGANEEPGIIPRAVCDIFQGICQGSSKREYLVRLSYLEIWNEIVKDLLDPTSTPQVRDDRRRGPNAVFIAPLQEEIVSSPSQVFDLLARGEENRHIGATDWNERSSRSHTCLKITVESWERDALHDDEAKVGRHYRISELHLIDLAGSERNSFYSANRRAEGANINKSLLSLSKVIYALSERQATGRPAPAHIPYRDSKLTRILQNSLNGSARVAVVCTLNPSPAMVEESLGTINFARRIKHVAVRAQPNEFDGDLSVLVGAPCTETQALLARYRAEMGALRAKVASLQQAPRTPTPSTPDSAPHTPTQSKPVSLDALQARLDQLGTLILRGGSVQESSAAPHPVSPAKRRGFTFDDPLPRVQEKLHAALTKIGRLERALATRIMLPEMADEKDRLIGDLLQQVRELEVVCQAQREDDAPSYEARLDEAEEKIAARDAFLEELTVECARLRRANKELVLLAHQETARMVEAAQPKRRSPIMSLFAPQLRPATVLGMAPCASTPLQSSPLRAWKQHKASIVSIDASESESSSDLSNSGLAELLEE